MQDDDPLRDTDQTDRIDVLYQQLMMHEEALGALRVRIDSLEGEVHKVLTAVRLLHNAAHSHAQRLEAIERAIHYRMHEG
jgi:hypothetical protein